MLAPTSGRSIRSEILVAIMCEDVVD